MIRLTPFNQKPGFCGPAALRVVLAYYGVNVSEERLTELCKTTQKEGTWHKDIVAAARAMEFSVYEKAGGTIEELKKYIVKKTPVIVGWYAFNDDHYSVIYNITDAYIHTVDTEGHLKERKRHMSIKHFKEMWFDYDNPKNPKEKTLGWFMVITPKENA